MVLLIQLGTGIANIIFAQNFLNFSSCSLELPYLCGNPNLCLAIGFMTTIPLIFIKSDQYFRIVSLIAFTSIVGTLTIILGYSASTLQLGMFDNIIWFDMKGFFGFYGVSLFIFEGIGLMFPIRYRINNQRKYKWIFTYISGLDILFQMLYSTFAYIVKNLILTY